MAKLNLDNIRIPEREAIPAWYYLRFEGKNRLIIDIHKDAMTYLRSITWDETPMIQHLLEKFRFEAFIPPSEQYWGFGKKDPTLWGLDATFGPVISQESDWESWECMLPVFYEDCDHDKFMMLRASLSVLFQSLQIYGFDGNTGWQKPQLIVIEPLYLEYELDGGRLWATLTPAMMQFLHKQPDHSDLAAVTQAMRTASGYMHKSSLEYGNSYYFRAECRQPKWINLTIPGNACGLDPQDYWDKSIEYGYKLCPHNVDSSMQQLAFLAGLAKLCDLARQQ